VVIGRRAEECFDAYSELERIPEWNPILGRVKVISPTRSEWSARLPPALARIVPNCQWTSQQCLDASECTISWESVSGIDTSGEATFKADGPDACLFTLTISYSLPDWLRPVATSPLARRFVNTSVNTTVERFKAAIEAERTAAAIAAEIDELAEVVAAEGCDPVDSAIAPASSATQRTTEAPAAIYGAAAADAPEASAAQPMRRARWRWRRSADAKMVEAPRSKMVATDAEKVETPRGTLAGASYTSEVGAQIEVACSASKACEAYADLESFPQYAPLLKRVCVLGEGLSEWELQLPGLMTRLVRVVGMGSLVKWQATYSVDPPRRLTWRSLSGFENAGTATFEPLGDERCRVVVCMTYSVPTVLKPLEKSSWVRNLMSSTMLGAMEAFCQRLETRGAAGEPEE